MYIEKNKDKLMTELDFAFQLVRYNVIRIKEEGGLYDKLLGNDIIAMIYKFELKDFKSVIDDIRESLKSMNSTEIDVMESIVYLRICMETGNYDIKNSRGETLLDMALRLQKQTNNSVYSFIGVSKYLVNKGIEFSKVTSNDDLFLAASMGAYGKDPKMFEYIINKYPQILDYRNKDRDTILHIAVRKHNLNMVKYILERVPDKIEYINIKNKEGRTVFDELNELSKYTENDVREDQKEIKEYLENEVKLSSVAERTKRHNKDLQNLNGEVSMNKNNGREHIKNNDMTKKNI